MLEIFIYPGLIFTRDNTKIETVRSLTKSLNSQTNTFLVNGSDRVFVVKVVIVE